MGKVYAFTNENLTSFDKIYDFYDARVLSVLGSGDQYFSALLFGAKEIELFDINDRAWDYFLLKYNAIKYFSYGQFYDTFIQFNNLCDVEFKRAMASLSTDKKQILEYFRNKWGHNLGELQYEGMANTKYAKGANIPYLDYDGFYTVKDLLHHTSMPKFYCADLLQMPYLVNNKEYDLLLTSNIFHWMGYKYKKPIKEYKDFLMNFNCADFQALYTWGMSEDIRKEFVDEGYIIDEVSPSREHKYNSDLVLTLHK